MSAQNFVSRHPNLMPICNTICNNVWNSAVADPRSRETHPRTSAKPMAIIIDKGQGLRPPSPPPSHPPPSYNESTATQPLVVHPGASGVPSARVGYGPTPIGQQQQAVLPYYDPRSPHSVQAAKRRARERFFGAVLWVVVIYALLSVLVWMDVKIQLGWSVFCYALLRAEPHRSLSFHQIQHASPNLLSCTISYWRRTYIGGERALYY